MVIIGLTGRNGSGKGEVARILGARGFGRVSLSDALRAELASRGLPVTRERLIHIGRELRRAEGADTLARRVAEDLPAGRDMVIDSIRQPAEARWLRQELPGFVLWEVVAPARVRFARIRARGRESDPRTLEAFLEVERAEASSADDSGQDLDGTAALAGVRIPNAGDLEELGRAVAEALGASTGG